MCKKCLKIKSWKIHELSCTSCVIVRNVEEIFMNFHDNHESSTKVREMLLHFSWPHFSKKHFSCTWGTRFCNIENIIRPEGTIAVRAAKCSDGDPKCSDCVPSIRIQFRITNYTFPPPQHFMMHNTSNVSTCMKCASKLNHEIFMNNHVLPA